MDFDLEHTERPKDMSFLKHMIAGSLAGVAEHCLVYPVDTVKTYMQAAHSTQTGSFFSKPRGFLSTLKWVYVNEGFRSLFKGMPVLASGCVPADALYFGTYELSKHYL